MTKGRYLTLMLLLTGAQLHAAKTPAWVKGQDPAYPPHVYLTGVGVGKDLDGARSNARAEISRVFQTRVQQTLQETQTEERTGVGKKWGKAASTQQSAVKTRVDTEGLLHGVEIAQTWYDKKSKNHYALAVLNKTKSRAALASDIAQQEEGLRSRQAQANAAVSPLERARYLAQAMRFSQTKDELAARRRILDPADAPEPDAGASTEMLDRQLRETLARISVVLRAEAPKGSHLRAKVADRVTSLGFQVLAASETPKKAQGPVLQITTQIEVEPFDRGNQDWKFFTWKGALDLQDGEGKTLVSSAPSGQEGHLTEQAGRSKALAAGEDALAQETETQISKYVFGQ